MFYVLFRHDCHTEMLRLTIECVFKRSSGTEQKCVGIHFICYVDDYVHDHAVE